MNLVDSCGWLEYLSGGPNAGYFGRILADTEKLIVPTIVIFEVTRRLLQQGREDVAERATAVMDRTNVVELDLATAIVAARLSSQLGLSMADSIILATAQACDATIWTQDAHFKDVAGVKYVEKK
jgi:predicted nucleic acid-binding protein